MNQFLLLALALAASPSRVISLDEAIETARREHPSLRAARAKTEVARARADEARAALLPQLSGSAAYSRSTANYSARPGSVPPGADGSGTSTATFDTFSYFNLGLTASQLLFDFGQAPWRWIAANASAAAEDKNGKTTAQQVVLGVRTTFFGVRAQRALVEVATQTLDNEERHLKQIEGFVQVGTRPEIDLAQVRTNRANARVQLINAQNAYETSKALLNLAMGVEGATDYDVADVAPPEVDGENRDTEALLAEALAARPEFAAMEEQVRAQHLAVRSTAAAYYPSLSVSTGLSDAGGQVDRLTWNWNAQLVLSWPLFQGLLTHSQVREATAQVEVLAAQRDTLRQQVRLEVDQARFAVRAAKAEAAAAGEALVNARVRLRLAEGRYETGVGNAIELSDAQLALTNASAQQVRSDYDVAVARALLVKALGRP